MTRIRTLLSLTRGRLRDLRELARSVGRPGPAGFEGQIRENVVIRNGHRLHLGKGALVDAGCMIHCGGSSWCRNVGTGVRIGDRSYVGPNTTIFGAGGVTIGRDVLIGPGVVLSTQGHTFARTDVPIREQPHTFDDIVIDDDVWIGASATILQGVRIGRGAVIAAGAVVRKDVEEFSVVAGVPAIAIRMRKTSQ